MRKTNSLVSVLLIALLLGSLITWTPPVAAGDGEGAGTEDSPPEELQAQNITALFSLYDLSMEF